MTGRGIGVDHGPSQNGPYSRVRDLLATFTLNFFSYCDNEISSCINKAKNWSVAHHLACKVLQHSGYAFVLV